MSKETRALTFMHVQDHLSSEGIFLMADVQAPGFPIRYASLGFEELFELRSPEIVGTRCGDLIGGPAILASLDKLAAVASAAGCTTEQAATRLYFLTAKAGEACRVMMASPGTRVGVALLANCKKGGACFVCEVILLCLRHPAQGWPYCVGFQRDVTGEVPLRTLLAAASSEEAYASLMAGRGAALDARRAVLLGVGSENVVQYLHEKASDVFAVRPSPAAGLRATGAAFMHVQDHLSTEGTFLMGDARAAGFPISYASLGFEDLFGFSCAELVGRKCGDVIGGPAILASRERLAAAASAAGCSAEQAATRIYFLTAKAGEACRVMMAHPGTRVGVALLVNTKKGGELFACEVIVLCLQHPTLGWPYTVGFQRDVSEEVPVHVLMAAAASEQGYAKLMEGRRSALDSRRAVLLGVGRDNVVAYLHEKASDVFRHAPAAPAQAAKQPTFMHVQEHLSTEGVFLMADAQAAGFPIRYASLGFEELFEYRSPEIVGRKCGDLIGGPAIVGSPEKLAAVARIGGCTVEQAATRVYFLTAKAGEACRLMMCSPGTHVGVALLINSKKSGVLFVCEVILLCLQHPVQGWPYCVGFQRDVSREVPLRVLISAAASEEAYANLMASRRPALDARRAVLLGVGSENVVGYLHEKAADVFSTKHSATFQHVQQHLSTEGTFLMGDAQALGFPIRFASEGFEQLYGYDASDIVGRKCGDLIGGPFITGHVESLHALASAARCHPQEAQARVQFLTAKAGEACRIMMANPGQRVGVALLVNRKKNGQLFVCECIVLCLEHPTLDWRYTVGFQRDISKDVPLGALLAAAASDQDYAALIRSRSAALETRRSVLLGVGGENVVRYLHEKALDVFSMDIWRTLRSQFLASTESTALGKHKYATPSEASTTLPLSVASSSGGAGSNNVAAMPPAAGLPPPLAPAAAPPQRPQLALPAPPAFPAAPAALVPLPPAAAGCAPPGAPQQQALRAAGPAAAAAQAPAGAAMPMGPVAIPPQLSAPGMPTAPGAAAPPGYSFAQVLQTNPVVQLLQHAQLESYAAPLLVNGFDDLQTIVEMQDEDMKGLGIPRGHALKLKRTLQDLRCFQVCALRTGMIPPAPTLLQGMYGVRSPGPHGF